MTTERGRDGRPLVTTALAAYSLGVKPSSFRTWAARHSITAADYQPNPRCGQPIALWDLADIAQALAPGARPVRRAFACPPSDRPGERPTRSTATRWPTRARP